MADEFNKYFSEIAVSLRVSLPNVIFDVSRLHNFAKSQLDPCSLSHAVADMTDEQVQTIWEEVSTNKTTGLEVIKCKLGYYVWQHWWPFKLSAISVLPTLSKVVEKTCALCSILYAYLI